MNDPVPAIPGDDRVRDRRAMFGIALAALLAYFLCLGGDFVYDDVHSVRDNKALTSLANTPRFFTDVTAFSSLDCRLYRPVLLTSYAIDAQIGGMQAWSFKLTNLLLHIAAALLLFNLARRLGVAWAGALVASALFAVHPLASEAINTISGRSNLLMVVGLLAATRCHVEAMAGSRWAVWWTVVFGAVAMGCKEPGMILPVLLVILEGLRIVRDPDRRAGYRSALLRVLPSVALVVGYVYLRADMLGAASFGVNQWSGTDVSSGHTRGMATQLATMALLLPRALLQTVVPLGLTMDPPIPYTSELGSLPVLAGVLLLLLLTALGLRAPRRHPTLFFGTCLAWGTAAPWVLKPLNLPFLEHRFYGVLAGLTLVVATWLQRLEFRTRSLPVIVTCAVLLGFASLSGRRSLEFQSEEQLWTLELRRNPMSSVARAGIAVCHMQAQRYAEALPYLEDLVAAFPFRRHARMNLAEAALKLRDPDVALEQSRFLVKHWERNPFYWLLHSRALAASGTASGDAQLFDEAVAAALYCLEIAEPKGLVFRTAAAARRAQGDREAAIALLDRSVEQGLDHYSVLMDRFDLLVESRQYERARRDLERVRQQRPFDTRVFRGERRLQAAVTPR